MRITVDHNKCEGHALCLLAAPEVFEAGDDDRAWMTLDQPGEELRPSWLLGRGRRPAGRRSMGGVSITMSVNGESRRALPERRVTLA